MSLALQGEAKHGFVMTSKTAKRAKMHTFVITRQNGTSQILFSSKKSTFHVFVKDFAIVLKPILLKYYILSTLTLFF